MAHSKTIRSIRSLGLAVALGPASLAILPGAAGAGMLGDGRPDAILCDVARGKVVFYADHVSGDGVTTYGVLGPTGLELTLQSNGVVRSPSGRGSCHEKTVKELRDAGEAFDFAG